jgi:hypothetical protein
MATYTLISSNVLLSDAATVTFSSIPATYTDLVIKGSLRNTGGTTIVNTRITFNSIAGTAYSYTYVRGSGSAASSGNNSNGANTLLGYHNGSTSTTDTFASLEVYIPSYTASQNKSFSSFISQENNLAAAFTYATAGLLSDTAAINSITLTPDADDWLSGSSFYLYGISNA